jgi:cell division protein FtsX
MHRRFCLAPLAVAVVLGAMAIAGCSSPESPSAASTGSPSTSETSTTTTEAPSTSTSTSMTQPASTSTSTPTTIVPLSAAEAQILARIQEIRAGLADGTWVFDPDPSAPPATDANSVDVVAYLTQEVADATALEKEIEGMPEVARVTYVSTDEALARLKEDFKDNPEVLEGLVGNPLPASFEIWLRDPSVATAEQVKKSLEGRPGVDQVDTSSLSPADDSYGSAADAEARLHYLEDMLYAPDLSVYLKPSAGPATSLMDEIENTPGVLKVSYVSPEEALAKMKEEFKDQPELLEGLETEPVPATLEIWLKDDAQAAGLQTKLQDRPEVDEVQTLNEAGEMGQSGVAGEAEFILGSFHRK